MNKKEHNKATKDISAYFTRLYHVCNNKTWVNPVGKLEESEKREEKIYRNTRDFPSPLSISSAAKLFTVEHIFEGFEKKLDIANMLHIRLECYIGQAIATEYEKEIREEFSQEEIDWFLKTIDYAKLMEDLE